MSRPIDVRPARPEDARALSELLGQLGYTSAPEQVARRLIELAESRGNTVLVAIDETTPIGLLSLHLIPLFHRDGCIGRITALVVREDFRSGGVRNADSPL